MTLNQIALRHGADKSSAFHNYCVTYEKYFEPIRDNPIAGLEVGYQFGFGLKTLAEYFHNGDIYGVDIADGFKTDNPHIHLFQGNQSDRGFWSKWMPGLMLDWVIDDASHLASDQRICFDCLWPRMKSSGLYIIEDFFTVFDYWFDSNTGGGLSGERWIGELVSALNQGGKEYYGRPSNFPSPTISEFEKSIEFIHCFRGLVIIKKK